MYTLVDLFFSRMINDSLNQNQTKRILITGASSGIGYQAVLKLLRSRNHTIIMPCRSSKRAEETKMSLLRDGILAEDLSRFGYFPIMDLSDLNSVERFVRELFVEGSFIDTLVFNAGLQYTGFDTPRLSKQGIELTFAVNHLANQYIFQRIFPLIKNSRSSRIIITSSEVHDPSSPGGRIGSPANLGELKGLELLGNCHMLDGSLKFNADKAYKDSKLCNLLFAKEIVKRAGLVGAKINVIAWAPGLVIPKTDQGFFRYSRKNNELGQRIFAFIARDLLGVTETIVNAGELLRDLCIDKNYESDSFEFYSNKLLGPRRHVFESSAVSNDADDSHLSHLLWQRTYRICKQHNPNLEFSFT